MYMYLIQNQHYLHFRYMYCTCTKLLIIMFPHCKAERTCIRLLTVDAVKHNSLIEIVVFASIVQTFAALSIGLKKGPTLSIP